MNRFAALGLAMLTGVAVGAAAIDRLNAQSKAPGAYAIVEVSFITSADVNKHVIPKAALAVAGAGGHFIARTEKIVAVRGTAPRRFVIIAFDSMDEAKA